MGGLGNQLFQYCLALHLQQAGKEVVLEKRFYNEDAYKRTYLLDILPSRLPLLENKVAKQFIRRSVKARVKRFITRKKPVEWVSESSTVNWQTILTLDDTKNYYVVGYWQEAEWVLAEKTLLQDLKLLRETIAIPEKMKKATVAVHVRQLWECDSQGNKLNNEKESNANFIWLAPDYYAQAIKKVREKDPHAIFAIFGDDEQWCKNNILPLTTADSFVMPSGQRADWQDMLLMSRCQTVICANSTFSWWSSILCNGHVVAPRIWSQEAAINQKIHAKHWEKL